MSNEIQLANQLGLGELVVKALSQTQLGWLVLERRKAAAFETIQKFELSIQGTVNQLVEIKEGKIVNKVEKDLAKIQEAVKKIKAEFTDMKDCRLQFTNVINEKLIEAAMAFEKRSAGLINLLAEYELEVRSEASKKSDEEAALNREVASFKTHIENEYFRIATGYRNALKSEASKVYVSALESEMSTDGVPELVAKLKETIRAIQKPRFEVFKRTLIDAEKAKELFLSVPAYNSAPDLEKALLAVDEMFSMYANDLANAEEAAKSVQQEAEKEIAESNERLEIEQATNILTSQASPSLIMSGGPKTKVKKKMEVVIEESETWELLILNTFIKNWKTLRPKIQSSSAKITIGQMATAIGKLVTDKPEEIKNMKELKFEEKKK
jgi:hypothetical protein